MKKIIKNSLSILFILILTSCGGGGGSETKVEETALYDFDITAKANKIEFYSEELYGGNTIAYNFEIKNYPDYPDMQRLFCVLYVDGTLIGSGYLFWSKPYSGGSINSNEFQFLTKAPGETLRVKLYKNSPFPVSARNSKLKEDDLIGDKTIDISDVEIEPDTRTQLKD